MIILGIDPGTAATGYGVVDRSNGTLRAIDHGCLVTSPRSTLPERLRAIHVLVGDLIDAHRPNVLAVERLYFSRNAQTAMAVGHARGVILLAAAEHGVPVIEATPNAVKHAVAGYGAADKDQVGRMCQLILGMVERPEPDDAADALAIAIWGAHAQTSVAARRRAGGADRSSVLDRAAIAPIESGDSAYERAVRDSLSAERRAAARGRRRAG